MLTSTGRFVASIVAVNVLILVAWLLFALGQPVAAAAMGGVTVFGFVGVVLIGARLVPREHLRRSAKNRTIGVAFVSTSLLLALIAAALVTAVGDLWTAAILAVVAAAFAMLAWGAFNAAGMQRLVSALLSHGEQPRALAVGFNGMPGRTRRLVVATDDRIMWADGRRLQNRHVLRLEDTDRFHADPRNGTLTFEGGGRTVRVRPVSRRELEKFERLVRAAP